MESSETGIRQFLDEWAAGDESAKERLVPVIYQELRRLAGGFLARERVGHTLQPTALAHEAILRFFDQRRASARTKEELFGLVAQLMRRVLVDHARRKATEKRGGDLTRITLVDDLRGTADDGTDVLELDKSLKRLEAMDPRQARVVELRVFGGFSVKEVAEMLGVSPATVKREWSVARAWLHRELSS